MIVLLLVMILIRVGIVPVGTPSVVVDMLRPEATNQVTIPVATPGEPSVSSVSETNIYGGPSTEYPVIEVLPAEHNARVIGVSPDGLWWGIDLSDSRQGWILASVVSAENTDGVEAPVAQDGSPSISVTLPAGAPALLTASVNAEIQTGPGSIYETVGYLESGETAEVVGVSTDGQWLAISVPALADGQGWVSATKVETENAEAVPTIVVDDEITSAQFDDVIAANLIATSNLNIRSGPGTNFESVGLLEYGQTADAIGIDPSGRWWALRLPDGGVGWIVADYVQVENLGEVPVIRPETDDESTSRGPSLTAITVVNIRGGPGTEYDILGTLQLGQQVEVVGRSADGMWWVITVPGTTGVQGWVAAEFARVEKTADVPIIEK
jgi:uncharacterized protein YraI